MKGWFMKFSMMVVLATVAMCGTFTAEGASVPVEYGSGAPVGIRSVTRYVGADRSSMYYLVNLNKAKPDTLILEMKQGVRGDWVTAPILMRNWRPWTFLVKVDNKKPVRFRLAPGAEEPFFQVTDHNGPNAITDQVRLKSVRTGRYALLIELQSALSGNLLVGAPTRGWEVVSGELPIGSERRTFFVDIEKKNDVVVLQ